MKVFERIAEVRGLRWAQPESSWGLVPTMGFLHEGHMSLVQRAREENDRVGISIFVNPAQFHNPDDLANYPSNLAQDLAMLADAGVDMVWTPDSDTVYPPNFQTHVDVTQITAPLEGASRPGHFQGVATVVAKLFNVFEPTRAYFGQKDAQQALTICRMVEDLNFNLSVVVCETKRDADGLALSSRNANLSPEAREQSVCLFLGLQSAATLYRAGERDAARLRAAVESEIQRAPIAILDYVSVANRDTLIELDAAQDGALISVAAMFGDVRLIDNIVL
jgi:pantoate--beta-alanine ligase